jgi:alpha-tubulin suppressor-like RCC1 family protein
VTPGTASVQVGGTTTLTATPRDANNAALTGRTITWSTSAAAVATVAGGVVTAVSAGSAIITATSEGKSGTATITVTSPPPAAVATVIVTPGTASVQVGGTTTLTAETRAANNAVLTGRVITWSTSSSAIATVANGVVTAVSAGTATITATSEGQNGTATVTVTAPALTGLTAGGFHTCVVRTALRSCWGTGNGFGNGSFAELLVPTVVAHTPALSTVVGGFLHACGLTGAGAAWCWGSGNNGALGDGATLVQLLPVAVSGGRTFAAIFPAAFDWRTCGIEAGGAVWCWGHNGAGALGDGTQTDRWVPVAVAGVPVSKQVVSGDRFTCALTVAGAAWCWGRNASGELGDGTQTDRALPAAVLGGHTFTELAAGFSHVCGVRTDGVVMCWGLNSTGQLGDQTNTTRLTPTASAAPAMAAVRAGAGTTCGLTAAGAAWCWGAGASGILGVGSAANTSTPAPVVGGHAFLNLVMGVSHVCGTTATQAYCWGNAKQLGLGGGGSAALVPTLVPGIP